jgi:hypothetical protein
MPGILQRFRDAARRLWPPQPQAGANAAPDGDPKADLLDRIDALEAGGKHEEVIRLCESAIDGKEAAEVQLSLSRCCFKLASQGNELFAWPALLAALDGIEKRCASQGDIGHAVGICRWVLELFADPHRLDVLGCGRRLACGSPETGTGGPPPVDLDALEALNRRREYVRLGNALLAAAPSVLRYGRDECAVARECRYLLASVASSVAGDKVAGLLASDDYPMPGDHDAQHYDRYLLTAAQARRRQRLARRNGVPTILITAIPKSASEFLCYTLAEATGAAIGRVSIGDPFRGTVYAPWVTSALQGGCVTHDHFAASGLNLSALRDGEADQVVVLVRDPRAACWSLVNMLSEWDKVPPAACMTEAGLLSDVNVLSRWIDSWLTAKEAGFPVTFVHFRELTSDPAAVLGALLESRGASRFLPRLHDVLRQRTEQKRISSNFRRGDDDAWREHVPAAMHTAIWGQISLAVRDLLDLAP